MAITREPNAHEPASYEATVRIVNTDGQGHGDYANAFLDMGRRAVGNALKRAGIERPHVAAHSYTQYRRELFMGEKIHGDASIMAVDGQHVAIKRTLRAPDGKVASEGYTIYLNDQDRPIADSEINDQYQAAVHGYLRPKQTPPEKPLGTEVELTPDERHVYDDQLGPDGVMHATGMFKLLHTFGYEKAIMEGTGEGFEAKSGKPVMADSSVMRMILSGQMLKADEAKAIGLVDEVSESRTAIDGFVADASKRAVKDRHKTRYDNSSLADAGRMLDDMAEKLQVNREAQLATLRELQASGGATPEQAANIDMWMTGVHLARLKALEVMKAQLETKDPQKKSDIERQAFTEVSLTQESKFATQFWLLNKKAFKEEHRIIEENPVLKESGLELTPEELKAGRGQAAA